MARSLTGMRMQGRLLDILRGEPTRVFTKDELMRKLRLNSTRELDALAMKTREQCRKGGCPAPTNVWGVGYRMEDYRTRQ
jgi:DNA-binding response OmpR family regulator